MRSSKLIENATLKVSKGTPQGMCTTHKDQVNADLLGVPEVLILDQPRRAITAGTAADGSCP
jgi:hypothetical protein